MAMPINSFRSVVSSFRTHKEASSMDIQIDGVLNSLDELKALFPRVSEDILSQAITVRKKNRKHVIKLLENFVEFRDRNQWPYRLTEGDIPNPVVKTGIYETGICPETGMRMLIMRCRNVDLKVASTKEFHKYAAYLLEQLTVGDEIAQEKGIALEIDFAGSHSSVLVRNLSGEDLSRGLGIFLNFPAKIKRIYLNNTSTTARFGFKAVLLVATRAVRSKVFFVSRP